MAHREAGTKNAPAAATTYQRARAQESFWRNRAEAHEDKGELRQAAAARGRQAVARDKVQAAQRTTTTPPAGATPRFPTATATPREQATAQAPDRMRALALSAKRRIQDINRRLQEEDVPREDVVRLRGLRERYKNVIRDYKERGRTS